ncbi:winged helix-turn-helix domain-containing protein [Crossiella sp. SN42]|uniref:BTAD domain-containing putative transcriptional regulator n=1 Tax=Crossiella sp. SN42 TaxID=2944808 RepID=UPI00207C4618|nr:BTAD domain-containing putative transcriptional regulator [Crossiella sp. SN42]MCO1580430.1 winged helix-turn-helix domain-containing protein [Crossiella sp. SN42]
MSSLTAEQLTGTEREVLRALGRGRTDAEIGRALAVTEQAVTGHVRRIQAKLGLRDRAAAIVYAFDHGITLPRTTPAPAARLRISVLGPVRAWHGAEALDLGPVRQQSLLAALVLRPDLPVSQAELLHRVWGLEPPLGNVVPVYVYRLRKCLHRGADPVIERDQRGYRFRATAVDLDLTGLTRIAAEAATAERAGDLAEAVRAYRRALALFRGDPLAGLLGPFAETERLRLTDRRVHLALRAAHCQLRLGRHAETLDELWALASVHPHHEPLAALLMRALSAGGRPADALALFDRVRDRLAADLAARPGPELRRMRQAVLHGAAGGPATP